MGTNSVYSFDAHFVFIFGYMYKIRLKYKWSGQWFYKQDDHGQFGLDMFQQQQQAWKCQSAFIEGLLVMELSAF